MTDLLDILPDLELSRYSHILPSLERACITTADFLTLDSLDIAKRASVPLTEVRRLSDEVFEGLSGKLTPTRGVNGQEEEAEPTQNGRPHLHNASTFISTLDDGLDFALRGGVPTGCITEVTGESAAGKTQLLLSLCLAVQLPPPHGAAKSALYVTTEAPLQTTRLSQILEENPLLARFEGDARPSLSRIQGTKVGDVESQDHVLRYQLPIAIERHNVGLVIIDSVTANFRAELDHGMGNDGKRKSSEAFAERSRQMCQLGSLLRDLARKYNIAVVVANQVLDRFTANARAYDFHSQPASQARSLTEESTTSRSTSVMSHPGLDLDGKHQPQGQQGPLSTIEPLILDHQQKFFTGWGDLPPRFPYTHAYHATNLKTPSLGLTWTNQLSARLVLLKEPIYKAQDYVLGPGSDIAGWHRTLKVAFASWCPDNNGVDGTFFEIWSGGLRVVSKKSSDETAAQHDDD